MQKIDDIDKILALIKRSIEIERSTHLPPSVYTEIISPPGRPS